MNTHGGKAKMLNAITLIETQDDAYDFASLTDRIMDIINDYDIIFIPASEGLLNVLDDRNIDYDLFYPSKERRGEFIENMVRKRAPRNSIMMIDRDFDKIVDRLDAIEAENCYKHQLKGQGQFIGNDPSIMSYINSLENHKAHEERT